MTITVKQKNYLKKLAHHLKPVVLLGNAGLSEGVINEINIALDHHELIKIKINAGDRTARKQIADEIQQQCSATFVTAIGRIAIFYRQGPDKKIQFPRL
jgi:RNA-binding protein